LVAQTASLQDTGATGSAHHASGGSNPSAQAASGGDVTTPTATAAANVPGGATNANPDPNGVPASSAVPIVVNPFDADSSPSAPAKPAANAGKTDTGDDADTANSATPRASSQVAVAPDPQQPVAAVLLVNTAVDPAPPANAAAAATTIGEPNKGPAKLSLPVAFQQDVPPAPATDINSAKPAPAGTPSGSNVETASALFSDSAKTQTASGGGSPQQAPTSTASDAATMPVQTAGLAPFDADHASVLAPDLAAPSTSGTTTSPSNPQGGQAGSKGDVDGLPNFGFSAAAVTTPPAGTNTTPSGTASTPAVPIAGLAVAIAARARDGSNQFDIRLDPPELGRIDVRLDVDSSGHVTTHMTADRADTLQLLQSQQPQLERALEQAGLKTADNGLQFTLRDQSFAGQNNGSGAQSNSAAQLVIPDADLTPVAATQIYARAGLGGGVDIRV